MLPSMQFGNTAPHTSDVLGKKLSWCAMRILKHRCRNDSALHNVFQAQGILTSGLLDFWMQQPTDCHLSFISKTTMLTRCHQCNSPLRVTVSPQCDLDSRHVCWHCKSSGTLTQRHQWTLFFNLQSKIVLKFSKDSDFIFLCPSSLWKEKGRGLFRTKSRFS